MGYWVATGNKLGQYQTTVSGPSRKVVNGKTTDSGLIRNCEISVYIFNYLTNTLLSIRVE